MIPHRQLFASLPAAILLAACSSRLAALPRVSPDCKFSMSGDHILCGGSGLLASSRYAYDVGTGILKRVD